LPSPQETDRARGALYGLAIGDALGMPTQLLSRQEITGRWGPLLSGFEPAPPGHPIAAGMPAGAVTDDTEQAVLLGRLLLSGPVDPRELADALVAWERDMAARGSLDLLGPSTRRAVEAVLAGTPRRKPAPPVTRTAPRCGSPRWGSRKRRMTCRRWSQPCTGRVSSRTTRRWRCPAPLPWPPR